MVVSCDLWDLNTRNEFCVAWRKAARHTIPVLVQYTYVLCQTPPRRQRDKDKKDNKPNLFVVCACLFVSVYWCDTVLVKNIVQRGINISRMSSPIGRNAYGFVLDILIYLFRINAQNDFRIAFSRIIFGTKVRDDLELTVDIELTVHVSWLWSMMFMLIMLMVRCFTVAYIVDIFLCYQYMNY